MTPRQKALWQAQLKAARKEERQWAKAYNRAERALLRTGARIDKLEKRLCSPGGT